MSDPDPYGDYSGLWVIAGFILGNLLVLGVLTWHRIF
jgi:hypothetical protein